MLGHCKKTRRRETGAEPRVTTAGHGDATAGIGMNSSTAPDQASGQRTEESVRSGKTALTADRAEQALERDFTTRPVEPLHPDDNMITAAGVTSSSKHFEEPNSSLYNEERSGQGPLGQSSTPSLSELMQRAKSMAAGVNQATAHLLREKDGQKNKKAVTIYARDQNGLELSFFMRRNMRMECFMKAYANKRQITARTFTFFYNSARVEANDTPDSLQMKDEDRLLVEACELGNENDVITITVRHESGKRQALKVKMSTMMERVFEAYASLTEHQAQRLTFFQDGQRIPSHKTAREIGLRDHDLIDARVDIIELFLGDGEADDVKVKMKRTRNLQSAFDAYGQAKSLELSKFKFVYQGQRLDGQYTPADLRMKDLDRIDCVPIGPLFLATCTEGWQSLRCFFERDQ